MFSMFFAALVSTLMFSAELSQITFPGESATPADYSFRFSGTHPTFPYDLENPDLTFDLPASLKEVSGLSLTADGSQIAAIDDEKGIIFLLEKQTGQIVREIIFWEEGDYEGIEIVGQDAYAVKSSGTMYQVKDYASDNRQTIKIKSFLNKDNDVEGLGYDPLTKRLLVGCKGKGFEGDPDFLRKAIYGFNLETMIVEETPVFAFSFDDIRGFLDHCEKEEHHDQLEEYFTPGLSVMKFNPSGIAIHPLTSEAYVTSSTGKMLMVLDRQGEIVHLKKLKKSIHAQPEGLCFDTDGTLFISNEGKDSEPGRIIIFKMKQQ
jgi:uncharacterized protein YjiK